MVLYSDIIHRELACVFFFPAEAQEKLNLTPELTKIYVGWGSYLFVNVPNLQFLSFFLLLLLGPLH